MIGLRLRALNLAGLFALLAPGYAGISLGDSAQVLPKGRSGILMTYYDYSKIDERYDSDGDQEDLAADFNTSLDSSVFADLQAVEVGFGLPAGSASFGDTDVEEPQVDRRQSPRYPGECLADAWSPPVQRGGPHKRDDVLGRLEVKIILEDE